MSQSSSTPTANQAANLAMLFLQRVEASPDHEAFRYPDGDASDAWASVTWKQAAERVEALAAGLLAQGVAAEDRIGIASATRLEWILAALALIGVRSSPGWGCSWRHS